MTRRVQRWNLQAWTVVFCGAKATALAQHCTPATAWRGAGPQLSASAVVNQFGTIRIALRRACATAGRTNSLDVTYVTDGIRCATGVNGSVWNLAISDECMATGPWHTRA